jgi:hypothetical protein
MDRMPKHGEPCPGFIEEAGCSWRMSIASSSRTHCRGAPSWTGRWFSPRGDRWFRVWASTDHLEGLTGLQQFGGVSR